MGIELRPADTVSRDALRAFLISVWHAESVVAHGERLEPLAMPGIVAVEDGAIVGHVAYRSDGEAWEVVAIAARPPGRGVGGQLLDAVVDEARSSGVARVWLTTTNDNLDALWLYQRHGFRLTELRPGSMDRAREELKPEIPTIGSYGTRCATSSTWPWSWR